MKNYWYLADEKLYGINAIKHKLTGEVMICSKYGQIYEYSDSEAAILVRSPKIASKINLIANKPGFTGIKQGEETVFRIKNNLVPWAIQVMRIKTRRNCMVEYANI